MLYGTGAWIWEIPRCEGGDVVAIAEKAKEYGLSHVLVKIADGRKFHKANRGLYSGLIARLRSVGVSPWVWQYVYANDPVGEAKFGADVADSVGADGFVIDAEVEYKGKPSSALHYVGALKKRFAEHGVGIPIALSSYYVPTYHQTFPWKEFLSGCDLNMPQIYWHARNPIWAVDKAYEDNSKYGVPIFPTIGAYTTIYHRPSTMRAAINELILKGATGFNTWSWQHMGADRWQVMREYMLSFSHGGFAVVDRTTGEEIDCNPTLEDGVTRVDLRSFAKKYGIAVYDRIKYDGTVYTEML